ncbi:hypothetical protein DVK85_05155 [Flavobacterium arcticum]|uniref:Uncharacterized protein n=1 Tax=Flavobacterium arcticum TaxID=1784713 RepID=A0A345HAP2_9FLAO|nr:hypothetical protein [Flavobacterium arcticum]AXG73652.1 hypothetical protein DVK85_05155 [Flavobacterium arcticum]KAF2511602.1 hypothetical protein E0W72_04665 [Flavobacterium arcticum]
MTNYLNKKGYEVSANEIATLNGINTFIEYNNSEKLVIPEAYFFNKDGYLISGFEGTGCGMAISNIDEISNASSDNKEHFKDWITNYNFLSSDNTEASYDAYVIINWAMFVDGMNDDTSYNWYKSLKNNKDLNIRIIFLNLDIQENWKLSDDNKKVLGLE